MVMTTEEGRDPAINSLYRIIHNLTKRVEALEKGKTDD